MAINSAKRKDMENLIYKVFSTLDPSEVNTNKYKAMFSSMSDNEFDKFFKNLFASEELYLVLDIVNYERDLTIENIEAAAKILDVPLMEKVAMPFVNGNSDRPVLTKYEVPVG